MKCRFQSIVHTPNGNIIANCNRCIECRINKTEEWSTRLLFEAESHGRSCFVTLTYAPEFEPPDGSLSIKAMQDFIKRVRKYYFGNKKGDLKYYLCGEYGPSTFRPHYHLAILGVDFDISSWREYKKGHFTSPLLSRLWPFGFNEVGFLNKTTMNYVTGYIQKKLFGDKAPYQDMGVIPPFQLFSKKLGVETLLKHKGQFIDNMSISVQGKKMPIPRYYGEKLGLKDMKTEDGIGLRSALAYEDYQKRLYDVFDGDAYAMAQAVIESRRQKSIDLDARNKLFDKRNKI